MAADEPGLITGFKNFVLRGNVVDLAVAVVVGAAFTAVVNAFANDFIGSLIAALGGQANLDSVGFTLNGTPIKVGTVLTALVNFLIVAAVVYFLIVVPVNKLLAMRATGEEPEIAAPSEEVLLLQEIRDLLRDGARPADGASSPGGTTT